MKYIIDCSVGFKWVVFEPLSDKARNLRDGYRQGLHELLAPDIFPTEIANALLVAERRGRIFPAQSAILLADVLSTPPALHAAFPGVLQRAHTIAASTTASIYDCLYVALAEKKQCELVTADDKLVKNLQALFPFITSLASLP